MKRRKFVKTLGVGMTSFTIVPRHVLGGPGYTAPNDQITKAIIGTGAMGKYHLQYPGRLVALCDVDSRHLEQTASSVEGSVKTYHDFRELLQQADIDIVHIVTPPHWHGILAVEAAKAGKDIWCEKPMTRTIGEGNAVIAAVKQHRRIFRLNTWFRFSDNFYGLGVPIKPVKKLVRNRVFGWPLKITINASTGFNWKFFWSGKTNLYPVAAPNHLDYNFWLGPAPYKPYNPERVHIKFRGYWDYDGGGLGDMGQHYMDPAQYLLEKDNTSPTHISVDTPQQHPDAAGSWRRIEYTYSDGCKIVLDGENKDREAAFIEGPQGKLYPNLKSDIMGISDLIRELPDEDSAVIDFHESVKTRRPFALNESNGHRSCTLVNLGVIALRLGRNLEFDPVKQLFIADQGANRMIDQPMRGAWSI